MNWQQYWDQLAKNADPHAQVARTGQRINSGEGSLDQIAAHIQALLDLQPKDRLLDVCCGNGMLTRRLAKHCRETVGVDLSPAQIALASPEDDSVQYLVGNATQLDQAVRGSFDKINLYFSFQYLDTLAKGRAALHQMANLLAPGGKILLGDVPDLARLAVFYPHWLDRWKYWIKLLSGRSEMGKFWSEKAIKSLAHSCGLEAQLLSQPASLPYSHYRQDFLLFAP